MIRTVRETGMTIRNG